MSSRAAVKLIDLAGERVRRHVERKKGVLLDVSLGGQPQPNSLTFKDIGQSPLKLPWRLPDGCVHTAVVMHVLEFLKPEAFFSWFDELHRVMRPSGLAYLSGPFGGEESVGWLSEPQHRTRIIQETFAWLDDRSPVYQEFHASLGRAQPKPWRMVTWARVPGTLNTVSYNATLQAQPLPKRKRR